MESNFYYDPEEQVYILESDGKEYITKDANARIKVDH